MLGTCLGSVARGSKGGLEQDPVLIAAFVAEFQRTHAAAASAALGEGTAAGPAPASE